METRPKVQPFKPEHRDKPPPKTHSNNLITVIITAQCAIIDIRLSILFFYVKYSITTFKVIDVTG